SAAGRTDELGHDTAPIGDADALAGLHASHVAAQVILEITNAHRRHGCNVATCSHNGNDLPADEPGSERRVPNQLHVEGDGSRVVLHVDALVDAVHALQVVRTDHPNPCPVDVGRQP